MNLHAETCKTLNSLWHWRGQRTWAGKTFICGPRRICVHTAKILTPPDHLQARSVWVTGCQMIPLCVPGVFTPVLRADHLWKQLGNTRPEAQLNNVQRRDNPADGYADCSNQSVTSPSLIGSPVSVWAYVWDASASKYPFLNTLARMAASR